MEQHAVEFLRKAGAGFAHLFGSRAAGTPRPDPDYDVAAFFGRPVDVLEVLARHGVLDAGGLGA
ncbi:MAG: nucleotidyltransferase domain-containing protein [Acidimicrobiia bacterium]